MSFVVVREQGAKETLTEGGTGTRSRLAGERLGAVQWRELQVTLSCLRGNSLQVRHPTPESAVAEILVFKHRLGVSYWLSPHFLF